MIVLLFCLKTIYSFSDPELPFLKFPQGYLVVKTKKVFGKLKNSENYCIPIFSCDPPKVTSKQIRLNNIKNIEGDLLLVVDDDVNMVSHYFHFMEHLIGIWNFLTYSDPNNVKLIILAFQNQFEGHDRWIGPNESTRILLTALFPNAKIKLFKELKVDDVLKAKNIFLSSRLRSHGIEECRYNNMNGSARFYYYPERLQQMRDRLFDKLGIHVDQKSKRLRVTYCKRSQGRIMNPILERLFLEMLIEEKHCHVKIVDFAPLSFREQLDIIANTDLLIGVHGNGLTHLLFLPNKATVIEYYEGGESAFFRLFAQLRGLRYYGNSQYRWLTESYDSLENKAPFQDSVNMFDLETTMRLIKTLINQILNQ